MMRLIFSIPPPSLNPSIQYQIDANYLEDGWRSYMAKAVRDKFHKPTIAIGNIRNPQVAEDILAREILTSSASAADSSLILTGATRQDTAM